MPRSEQVRHGLAGSDVWQVPERVLEVRKQTGIRVREGWAATSFEHVHLCGRVLATDKVQPLLYVRFVDEPRCLITACGFEEGVEVELVKLTLVRDSHQVIRHPVGQQTHLR